MTMTVPNTQQQQTPQPVGLRTAPSNESVALAKRAPDDSFRLALEPETFEQAFALAKMISESGMWAPKGQDRLTPQQVMMRLLTGRNLGIPAVIAMQHIYDLYGRTGISAALKQALVIRHADCEVFQHVESDDAHATYKIKRRGNPEQLFTFHIKEATRAKLMKDDSNYVKWPKRMCQARAKGEACDVWFPDATMGLPTIDDLEDEMNRDLSAIDVQGTAPPLLAAVVPEHDWPAETARLKATVDDGASGTETVRKALRAMVAGFLDEAPAEYAADLKAYYNEKIGRPRGKNGATSAPVAPPPPAAMPVQTATPSDAASVASPPVHTAAAARAAARTTTRSEYVAPEHRGDSYEGPDEPEPPFGGE